MHEMYNVSVSKPVRGEKKGGWICSPTWKLHFTRPLIKIDYKSPAQSCEVSLNVTEPILTTEMLKKNLNYPNIFFDLNKSQKDIVKKSNKTMKFCNKNLKFLKYSKSWYSNSKKKMWNKLWIKKSRGFKIKNKILPCDLVMFETSSC